MDRTAKSKSSMKTIILLTLLGMAILPIITTPFPPSTDLPQHLAQVRLFLDCLASPEGPYAINWVGPNNLIYVFLTGLWFATPPSWMARAAVVLIVLLWLAAIYYLGPGHGRPLEPAIVAAVLVFNVALAWGFLNFLIGFPVFVIWFDMTTRRKVRRPLGYHVGLFSIALLLYGSHALWFAFGVVWLLVSSLLQKLSVREIAARITAIVPCGIISILWYPRLSLMRAGAGFDVAPHWSPLFDRILSSVSGAFGSARSPFGLLAFSFLYVWAALAVWQNRKQLRGRLDGNLLAGAVLFGTVGLLAPDQFMNSIFFSSRWYAPALIFLLLSLPVPKFGRASSKSVAIVFASLFFLVTAVCWQRYASKDLTGLAAALDNLPESTRVLGLDLIKESRYVQGRPYLQLFAYAQVLRGGELNFSFTEHYSGLVSYRGRREVPWTRGLSWKGENVQRKDFAFFDFVIVNGEKSDHEILSHFSEITPVTSTGRWRLYSVKASRKEP